MAFFSQRCFSLFLLHAILVASSTQSSALTSQKSEDLIRQTCKRTNNFNLCVTSLNSDPRSLNADVKGLARISLQQLLTKTNQTLQNVGNLFKDTRDPIMFRLLGNCIIEYNRAVTDYLPGAISALDSNNYGASKQGADDTATSATTCGDQFIIRGLPKVSVSTQSKQLQGLAMVASGIISTLGRTNNFNLCVASLESDPRSLKADVKGLARISLQQVLVKANQTLQIVGKLFNQTHDRIEYEFLGTCIEEYNKAVSIELLGAIIALDSKDYGESKQGAANVRDDANLCEQQWASYIMFDFLFK
ncbi:unnamed protein product [Camellia sinensis]